MKAAMSGGFEEGGDDFYLRKWLGIPFEPHGGPSPEKLRQQLEAEGKNYDIAMDAANRVYGVITRWVRTSSECDVVP